MPVFVAELVYDDEPWVLPDAPNTLRLRTKRQNVMWHKENLLNLVERIVPAEFDNIAWIDADIWFQRLDWYDATKAALQTYAVVQLFEKVALTGEDGRTVKTAVSSGHANLLHPGVTTPGHAWAARRSLWRKAGGLYERAIIGAGDTLHASVWLPSKLNSYEWLHYAGTPGTLERLRVWNDEEGGCGVLGGTIVHEWHGDAGKRGYGQRHALLQYFNVETQLVPREDGLLEYVESVPDWLRQQMQDYFHSRAEDGANQTLNPPSRPQASSVVGRPLNLNSRTQIINWLIEKRDFTSYLEIGLGDGKSFAEIRCKQKESVDPAKGAYAAAAPTHRMTSDAFFAQNTAKFDLIFIDGLHEADTVERDLENALAALTDGGIIVCHDLNPNSEAMQEVPRAVEEWTGDCWKAWVRLRCRRDDLFFAVADIDYGVGIILTGTDGPTPKLDVSSDELSWPCFLQNRREWLPLIPPGALPDVLGLTTDESDDLPLVIVTLWRPVWTDTQQAVFKYLELEDFPDRTHFIWTAEVGSGASERLESLWPRLELRERGYSVELIETEVMPKETAFEKHTTVAKLYNRSLSEIRSSLVFSVEDDVVPLRGSWAKLCSTLASLPKAAAVMGAYRTRQWHDCVCAGDLCGKYLSWSVAGRKEAVTASWIAAGLTLYRAAPLRKCIPAIPEQAREGWIMGWDMVVSNRLRNLGETLVVAAECVAEHRFQECGKS